MPFLLIGFLLFEINLFAQHKSISSNLQSAESRASHYFAKGAYREAVILYKQVFERHTANLQVMLKIAESYTKMNEQDQAVVWYEKAFESTSPIEPIHKLAYAQALSSVGNYTTAKIWFENFLKEVPGDRRAKLQLKAIENINTFYADSASYQIKKLRINTSQPEFGPTFYDEGLVFVSGRDIHKPVKWVNTADQSTFYDLYYSKISADGELAETHKLQQELHSRYHEGPVAIFENGNRIIFSQNIQRKTRQAKDKGIALFEAEKSKDGSSWINIKPLPFNNEIYSVAHPTVSKDGTELYFASDMPGGHGQSDIYVSHRVKGSWTDPQNLGPAVNTEGNEMFPYLHDNLLYFASNGLGGLGGLDVFSLDINKAGGVPTNLGFPINSSKDDFGFIINNSNTGYFSTNRIRENKDDIYWVKYINSKPEQHDKLLAAIKPATSRLKGLIIEKGSNKHLSGARIYIINEVTGEDIDLNADKNGNFTFEARLEDSYAIMGEKEDKNVFVINLRANEFADNKVIKLEASAVSFPKNIIIEATLYDSLTHEPVVFAGAYLFEGPEEKQKDYTSLEGKAFLKGTKDSNYWIEIISINYKDKRFSVPSNIKAINDTLKLPIPLQKIKRSINYVKGNIYNEENGRPVANAEVYILNEATGDQQTVFSDTKGDFKFEATSSDPYLLMAEKDNLHMFLTDVKIKDPEKYPADVLKVGLSSPTFKRDYIIEAFVIDSATLMPLRLVEVQFFNNGKENRVYTSSAGKAYFEITSAESLKVKASLKNYQHYQTDLPEQATIKDTLNVAIALQKSEPSFVLVEGFVFDKKTKYPVDQASIYLLNAESGEELTVRSNQEGRFKYKASPFTSYIIMGEKGSKSIFITDYAVKDSNSALNHKVELAIEEPDFELKTNKQLLLEAQIIDIDTKEPVKFAFISLYKAGVKRNDALADESGIIRFVLEKEGNYELRVEKPNFLEQTVEVSTISKQEKISRLIALSKIKTETVSVVGNIYDVQAEKPLSNANVYVLDVNTGEQTKVLADREGNFVFPAIKAHTYTIIGEKGNKSASLLDIDIAEVSENKGKKVQLLVQPAKRRDMIIFATVLDKDTKEPVKVASLKLFKNDKEINSTYTFLKGNSWLSAAMGEEYDLTVSGLNYALQSIHISTKAPAKNDTIQLNILLQAIKPVTVIQPVKFINKENGAPIAHAKVYLINKKTGEEHNIVADEKGRFAFNAKAGEAFSVLAEKNNIKAYLTHIEAKEASDTLIMRASPPAAQEVFARVIARDKTTREPIRFVEIQLSESSEETHKSFTSLRGEIVFKAVLNRSYNLKTSHINYKAEVRDIEFKQQDKGTITVELYLEKIKPIYTTILVQVIDKTSSLPFPNAAVSVTNEVTGEESYLLTNARGEISLKAKISDSYSITSNYEKYTSNTLSGIKVAEGDHSVKNYIQLAVTQKGVESEPIAHGSKFDLIQVSSGNGQLFVSADGILYEYISHDSVLLWNINDMKVLSMSVNKGNVASLSEEFIRYVDTSSISSTSFIHNIYYDFKNASLNKAAKEELLKISEIMKAYPSLVLKINAFTDSRGADHYNLTLSKQRAITASNYLISLGINSSRIASEGFGETNLIKPCPKPQDCNQSDHQLNRRGEFILNLKK